MEKSFVEKVQEVKTEVVSQVSDTKVAQEVSNVLDQQKELFTKCVAEMKRRGKATAESITAFAKKCWDSIKTYMHKLIGHIKDLWNKVCSMFSSK